MYAPNTRSFFVLELAKIESGIVAIKNDDNNCEFTFCPYSFEINDTVIMDIKKQNHCNRLTKLSLFANTWIFNTIYSLND